MENIKLLIVLGILALAGCQNTSEPGAVKAPEQGNVRAGTSCRFYHEHETQYDLTLKAGQYVFVKMTGAADKSFEDDESRWDDRNPQLVKLADGEPTAGGYEDWTFNTDGWSSFRIRDGGNYRFTYGTYSPDFGRGKALICPQDSPDFKPVQMPEG